MRLVFSSVALLSLLAVTGLYADDTHHPTHHHNHGHHSDHSPEHHYPAPGAGADGSPFQSAEEHRLKPFCCYSVEKVMTELRERLHRAKGNAEKLKEILDHCTRKLLLIRKHIIAQTEDFDRWVQRSGLPEKIGGAGDKGNAGANGFPGRRGPTGKKGDVGRQGQYGNAGYPGLMGRKGDTGPSGEVGHHGAVGVPGHDTILQGEKGHRGEQGPTGELGPEGPRGDTGDKGWQGQVGSLGNDGPQGVCLQEHHNRCRNPYRKHPVPQPETVHHLLRQIDAETH